MRRTLIALTTALFLMLATGAQAAGGGPDNVVWSKTTGANAVDEGSSLKVGSYSGDDLTSANVARAESTNCSDCRTAAVAIQAVFATGNPSTVEPTNAAIAVNQNCTRCTTFAFAYQYVVTTRDDFHLSGDARRQIAGIRHEAYDVAHSDLAPADMDARLNALATEFKSDIDGDLANQNERHHGEVKRDDEAPPAS